MTRRVPTEKSMTINAPEKGHSYRAHYTKLVESGVPAINVVFPWTDHTFDLILPQINPLAQSALYDLDRFLALLLSEEEL